MEQFLKKILPSFVRKSITFLNKKRFYYSYFFKMVSYEKRNKDFKTNFNREMDYIRKNKTLEVFPYEFIEKYKNVEIKVHEHNNGMKYIIHNDKKIFFPEDLDTYSIKETYRSLLVEQDKKSPHCYLDENIKIDSNTIIMDIGSAEGFLALELIDSVKMIYLFETDIRWIKALEATFEPWKNKVEIVNKFVANKSSEDSVKLDDYINKVAGEIFLKVDVEGAEVDLLKGGESFLKEHDIYISICTYHNQNDSEDIYNILERYKFATKFSDGYMIWSCNQDFTPPFFRKGLIRGWKR